MSSVHEVIRIGSGGSRFSAGLFLDRGDALREVERQKEFLEKYDSAQPPWSLGLDDEWRSAPLAFCQRRVTIVLRDVEGLYDPHHEWCSYDREDV